MDFHLGMDAPALWRNDADWLRAVEDAGVTLMVSHGRLRKYKTFRRATVDWVCDSRGFTELSQLGEWTITPEEYATALRRYAREIGRLLWASPQDWMCEDEMLVKTGLTVAEHQARTVASVVRLRELLAGEVHIIPVIQGKTLADYLRCVELYQAAGIDLTRERVVGLGSVCRRQATAEIGEVVHALAALGIKLHGFGVKTEAMDQYGHLLASADSFAWSKGARHRLGQCGHGLVVWERNCPMYALEWRDAVLAKLPATGEAPAVAEAPVQLAPVTARRRPRAPRPAARPRRRRPPLAPPARPPHGPPRPHRPPG